MSAFSSRPAVVAAAAAVLALTVASLAFAVPAGAAPSTSHANGRFLSGEAGGTSFDTIAALNGETADYPGNPGPNQNDLSGSLLGMSFSGPAKNISVPFPGGVTFGAVGQYAQASADGSANASSGLIGSNGAINVSGSGNGDVATIDLSKLPNASSLTDILGNLTLQVGAVSAHAKQAAFGKRLSDPAAGCDGKYLRVGNADQAGSYQLANLTLTATSPALKMLGSTLRTNLQTAIDQLTAGASATPLGGIISGLPDPAELVTLTVPGGGITAGLADGSIKIDLAKILQAAGLDLNNLCPNTSLLRYLSHALDQFPAALDTLFNGLKASFDDVGVTVGGVPLDSAALAVLLDPLQQQFMSNLSTISTQVSAGLDPALAAITENLLDVVVNAQDESDGTFTETAVQVDLIPSGGSLPTLPGLGALPVMSPAGLQQAAQTGSKNAAAKMKHGGSSARPSSAKSSAKTSGKAPGQPATITTPGLPLPGLPFAAGKLALGPISLGTRAATPALQLNLASASVTNARTPATSRSAAPQAEIAGSVTSRLPTGVPAGAAGHSGGGLPSTPLVLVLLGVVVGLGGWSAYRWRMLGRH